jgi:hypothetical protein
MDDLQSIPVCSYTWAASGPLMFFRFVEVENTALGSKSADSKFRRNEPS